MLKFESWKKLLVLLVTAIGIAYAAPNLLPGEGGSGGVLPGQKINLGLDLQGGSHLLLRVDMEVVARERLEECCGNHSSGIPHQQDPLQWLGR